MRAIFAGAGILLIVLLSDCRGRIVDIDNDARVTIDTTAARRNQALRPILDSLCEARFEGLVQQAVDSIMEVRKNEIEKLLEN